MVKRSVRAVFEAKGNDMQGKSAGQGRVLTLILSNDGKSLDRVRPETSWCSRADAEEVRMGTVGGIIECRKPKMKGKRKCNWVSRYLKLSVAPSIPRPNPPALYGLMPILRLWEIDESARQRKT